MSAPLSLHPLTFLEDGDEVVVGRRDIDSYAFFEPDGAALVRELAAGRSPARAAAWYRETYGEAIDIDDVVATLHELGFVREADAGAMPGVPLRVRWQRLGRALFSPAAWAIYAIAVIAAVATVLRDPALGPSAGDIRFTDSLLICGIALFAGQALLALVHESFHVLAGRRLGLRTSVRISRRFYYAVYETRLDGLVSVPRRARYLVILAGLLADVLVVSTLVLAAAVSGGVLRGLCLALAFTTLPRIMWQFLFHLRTDVYYLITTALGLDDLDAAARQRLRGLIRRSDRGAAASFGERDRRAARWYAPLMVAGYALSVTMLVLVIVPLATHFFGPALRWLAGERAGSQTLGSTVLLATTLFELSLALAVALRERRDTRLSAGSYA
jgi:hypothetical protein